MVYIDAVTVPDFEVVEDTDTVNHDVAAAYQMDCPVGTVADVHIAYHQLLDIGQGEYMRARVKVCDRFQLVGIVQLLAHEGHSVAVDASRTGDGHVFQVFSADPHHTFSPVGTKSALGIDAFIGIRQQPGIGGQL